EEDEHDQDGQRAADEAVLDNTGNRFLDVLGLVFQNGEGSAGRQVRLDLFQPVHDTVGDLTGGGVLGLDDLYAERRLAVGAAKANRAALDLLNGSNIGKCHELAVRRGNRKVSQVVHGAVDGDRLDGQVCLFCLDLTGGQDNVVGC